jgi:uncharacterized protein
VGNYLNNRVLKLNVGFLLSMGAGHSQDSALDIPTVRVSDDLMLDYVRGPLRLTRTQEGILVQAGLHVGINDECYRCLDPVARDVEVEIEELYGYHSYASSEFIVGDDAILDLSPLLRAEVLIDRSHRVLCRDDCKGLCAECGQNFNEGTCHCRDQAIDPRMAALKDLLESQ